MSSQRLPVVYVAGSGHSGSTLLALLLDSHPDIACTGETSVEPAIRRKGTSGSAECSCGQLISTCSFWIDVFARLREQGIAMGHAEWPNDYRFEHRLLQKRVINRACASAAGRRAVAWAADHLPFYRSRTARVDRANVAFIRAVLAASEARVFADTSKRMPRLTHLARIASLDVSVVALSRDVRGYAASAKRRGMSPLDAARTWRRDQESLASIAAGRLVQRVHRLRYEDLCTDLPATLRALWNFCGVREIEAPGVVNAASHHVLGNAMRMGGAIRIRLDESWRTRLDAGELQQVMEIAGDVNRSLGYR